MVTGQSMGSRVMGPGGMGQRMANPQGMMAGSRGSPSVDQILMALKQPHTPQQKQQLMEMMRKNPEIMASLIKHKGQSQQQQQGGPPPNMGGPPQPGHHVRPMHGSQPPEMWAHRQSRPAMGSSNMYGQPGMPPNTAYQMPSRAMHPQQMAQYSSGQPRYPGPGNDMMSQSPGVVMGHQQPMRAPGGMHPSHMLQQAVKSPPPVSLPQHTRSPQPMPSPRQQSTASPATLMQHDPMGNMMGGPGQPGGYPLPMSAGGGMQQGDFDQSAYASQQQLQPQQQPQDNMSLDSFVQGLS